MSSTEIRERETTSGPDGNEWLLQEVTNRLPGRVDPAYTVAEAGGAEAPA